MKILGTGSAVPEKVVTNDMLSQMMDTSDEWIRTRTGIKSRRILSTETLTDLAVKAAKESIDRSNLTAADIDYVLCHNVINDALTPSLAAIITKDIPMECPTLDLNGACVGFIYALDVADSLLRTGKAKNILIVCAEQISHLVDWSNRETCVLFGDAAGAVVVTRGDDDNCFFKFNTQFTDALYCSSRWKDTPFQKNTNESDFLSMRGREVFKMAVTNCCKNIRYVFERTGLSVENIDYFLLHQANLRILEAIKNDIGVPDEKIPINLDRFGNTSSACIPMLLDELSKSGKLKRGDVLLLSAFGAGFTSGAGILKW